MYGHARSPTNDSPQTRPNRNNSAISVNRTGLGTLGNGNRRRGPSAVTSNNDYITMNLSGTGSNNGNNYNRLDNNPNIGRRRNGFNVGSKNTYFTLKVSNVQLNSSAAELKEFFSGYGKVYSVRIETKDLDETPTGVANVTFKPAPDTQLWNQDIRFHGRILKLEPLQSNLNNDRIWQRSKIDTFPAEKFEMGVYLEPDNFVSEWKSSLNTTFSLDYQARKVQIQFGIEKSTFKMECLFKDIDGEIYPELNVEEQSRAIITFTSKFPGKFWELDEKMPSQDRYRWSQEKMWRRKVDLGVSGADHSLRSRPLEPTFPDITQSIGKWIVYRITFLFNDIAGGMGRFKEVLKNASDFNLLPPPGYFRKGIRVSQPGKNYIERRMLDFDVLYMVESNITHNYLHDYNLTPEFFELLARQPKEVAIEIMKTFAAPKKRIFDPSAELLKLNGNIRPENIKPPEYCVLMRKAVITPTHMYLLLPTMETSNRIIRHFRDHRDHFLRVQFTDEGSETISSSFGKNNDSLYNRVYRTLCKGIRIGNRHYEFLAFSSSQLREHSCWFFASTTSLTADDIRAWMGDFTRIDVVAKYAARMGQCFSSTRAIAHLPVNDIVLIPDIRRNGYIFSDGIGKISPNLSRQIAEKMKLKATPSAVQFRLGGYKGVLCMSRYLRENQIQVRPSQNKFDSSHCILEIIKGSCFISAKLNRQAITLLSALKVPDNVFLEMKDEQVRDLEKMLSHDHTAMKVLLQNIDEYGISRILADLVKAGFLQHKDPFLVNMMALFRIMVLKDLKNKAKISVPKGAFLLGVLDETETLKEEQVYICVSDQSNSSTRHVVTGPCVIFRNPCFHPGDIRIVNAVKCPKLDHLVDVLVFPSLGYRDIPNQCSGGDLDGDDYTIIWDERLFPRIKNYPPMEYHAPDPSKVDNVTIEHIQKFFINYILNDNLGQIANAHLAKADMAENGALHGSCLRLAQLHSEAVDFPKTGRPAPFPYDLKAHKVPDFMENPHKATYPSQKVLGTLYRSIQLNDFNPSTDIHFNGRVFVEGYEFYLEDARIQKKRYDSSVRGLMNQYGVSSEYEVVSGFLINAISKIERKKPREISRSIMDSMTGIRNQFREIFKQEFIGEGTMHVSPEAKGRMEAKAFAWYYVTYHPSELGEDPGKNMLSFPWCVHELVCEIAIKNSGRVQANEEFHGFDGPVGRTTYQLPPPRTNGIELSRHRHQEPNRNQLPDSLEEEDDDGLEQLRRSLRRE
ncbi:hypothetical protein G9A89_002731 [Geosiphon pyriformis]|nr:hypothetical protein G9A89_002731 [Geosiphon pyriformis]